jgi:hypothetical protein
VSSQLFEGTYARRHLHQRRDATHVLALRVGVSLGALDSTIAANNVAILEGKTSHGIATDVMGSLPRLSSPP